MSALRITYLGANLKHEFDSILFVRFHYEWNQLLCMEISLVFAHLDEEGAEEG